MLRYTLMRLGIFAGCFLALWGLVYVGVLPRGLGDSNLLWVLVLSIVISAPLSFVLLRKVRDDASAEVVARVDRAKGRLAANQSQEDAL
ncbi:DUF4229 domain-containing protein [Streptomyces sp. SR27]|uniref:DUF4229 domain-containing protein n=1 Tax=unclassified Streptomyces TaxID=2593676 RepID=UPI00295A6055|nr:DUF4229 domain-containing protein [Streptomyces sp. SR27]MDV9189556.1 DUF4229 domain-containing protein [Streptomyces sp. SR27]